MGRRSDLSNNETWKDKLKDYIHKFFHFKKRLSKAGDKGNNFNRDMIVCDHKDCCWDYEK